LPSNQTPLGALPSRFKKQRLLIVGCGDIGGRLARLARPNVRLYALTSTSDRKTELRELGITPILGNLDNPLTLNRLAGLGGRIVHLAPPAQTNTVDQRTTNLVRALSKRHSPVHLVYSSTSGVYGDCSGEWVSETRAINPSTDRAKRRVHAEETVKFFGLISSCKISLMRIPGIYGLDRPQGTPIERLKRGSPVLNKNSDVYTNHIHSNDLARAFWLAIWRGANQRTYNISDDSNMLMGDYMDWAADRFGYPRPPRVSLQKAKSILSEVQLSFMQESRQLINHRMKYELKLKLKYPSIKDGLAIKDTIES